MSKGRKELEAEINRLKTGIQDIIENGHNNNDEQETIYFIEQSTLYDILEGKE